ncbi:peptidase [Pseudomonas putida]|nr:peptidase [Pseudomonas putida]
MKLFYYAVLLLLPLHSTAAVMPPSIEARNYVLVDYDTGQILAAKDPHVQVEPASTTKLMTAYVVFKALREQRLELHQKIAVSNTAWRKPGSSMYIDPRMNVPVEDLIKGMLVQSGNDATNLLAETLGGTSDGFVPLMNFEAQILGMKNTSFQNPEGLPTPNHLSTAYDLAVLGRSILKEFPEYSHFFSIKNYYYPGTPSANSANPNLLLFRDPTVEGLKTGFTDSAGYCLVAAASRNTDGYGNRRLIAVLMGTKSSKARADETQKLLTWGFRNTQPVRLSLTGTGYESIRVWKGTSNYLRMGIEATTVVVPSDLAPSVKTHFIIPDILMAPIAAGQSIGKLVVSLEGRTIQEIPIIALEKVDEANFITRLWDSLVIFFKGLID